MKLRDLLYGVLLGSLPLAQTPAQEKKEVPAGTPVTIIVKPAEPSSPSIILKPNGRQAKALPKACGCGKTGGGNIDVQQPTPDVMVITVTAAALAEGFPCLKSSASVNVDLTQCFSVSFEKSDLKNPKITVEGRVIGALRTHCKGGVASETAQGAIAPACGGPALTIQLPSNQACNGDNLSINDHEGPISAPVVPGKYVFHANFHVSAEKCSGLCKPASAEFAPDPAFDPLWLGPKDPFHGIAKKDLGFQITIKVMEDSGPSNGAAPEEANEKDAKTPSTPEKVPALEKIPAPRP